MKLLKYILVLIFTLTLISCSDDDDNPVESSASPLNGGWEMQSSSVGGGTDYEITTNLNLTFEGSTVTGNGTIEYSRTENSVTTSATIQSSISGSYNDPNINISVTDGTTGYVFNYTGSWVNKNENFSGIAKVRIGSNEYTHQEMFLFKAD